MSARAGVVYLVGAGPGDPGLMTARSLELIAAADAIFYDRLIPPGALDGAREDAELVYVGKQPGVPSVPQEEIGERLIEAARAGKSVVRLKGGDPFVFGRGGEEGEALREAGVEFEVVPGVTAGVAATAYAGIPVTHRDDASAVAFVTGHEDPEKQETALDWEALARFPGTLVFYMGVRRLPQNAAALIDAGRDADEPAAAIERGTMAGQRTVTATLGTIAEAVEREGSKRAGADRRRPGGPSPGASTRLAGAAAPARPPRGRHPGPRPGQRAGGDPARARRRGGRAAGDPDRAADRQRGGARAAGAPGIYALVCLTSPNGVRLLFEALAATGLDARALAGATVAAIGPGTARALAERGIARRRRPRALRRRGAGRGAGRRSRSRAAASSSPAPPRPATCCPTRCASAAPRSTWSPSTRPSASSPAERVEAAQRADYVTFTSSSTVRNLIEALGDRFRAAPAIVSIGPVTSEAVREAGLEVEVEAERHDVDGLLAALLDDAASASPHRHYARTDSTNTRARELAEAGAPGGTVVTAGEQSEGRGRQGRVWTAPAGKALLYSAILRPLDERHLLLPLSVPLAVCEAAESLRPDLACRSSGPTTSGSENASSPES